ncbi:MAG: hypothetical protein IT538_11120 [Variibacter sp.]|nr:hypothetical protein [Variibacter sp.]
MDDASTPAAPAAAADSAGRAGAVTYAYKPSMISGQHTFHLGPDGLQWQIGRYSGTTPYRAIGTIRLSFKPVSLAAHRFQAEIWAAGTPKLTIASTSWRSMVEQQRHDAEFAAFVRALHRRLAEAGADPVLRTGTPAVIYWIGLAVFAAFAALVPVMLVRSALAGAAGGAGVIALLMAFFFYRLGTFFWRNRPGTYRLDAIPPAVLPAG